MGTALFESVAIVGVGLIGESIALAAARRWPSMTIVRIDAGDDLSPARDADLVVLSAPILANIRNLDALAAHLEPAMLVTDTGSTKRRIVDAAARVPSVAFIGGHPMAGAARGGAGNARADLFDGRPWILTPRPTHPADAVARLEAFVGGLGAVLHVMTPELHDRFAGAVSHLPQLTASALMHVVGTLAGDAGLEIAGTGLRDTTRLAASPAAIWKEIAASNSDVLRDALDALIAALSDLRGSLETGEAIDSVFTSACRWRRSLDD
jgi:prephenate dehydrogenase